MSPKVKTMVGEGIEVRSLTCNPLEVEGCVRAPGWGLGQVTNESIVHMNLHKPNNKLVSV